MHIIQFFLEHIKVQSNVGTLTTHSSLAGKQQQRGIKEEDPGRAWEQINQSHWNFSVHIIQTYIRIYNIHLIMMGTFYVEYKRQDIKNKDRVSPHYYVL